jgi:acetyl esterase/lipase
MSHRKVHIVNHRQRRQLWPAILAATLLASAAGAFGAEPIPAALYTDPPHDAKFPAASAVLHIPTHGVSINGLAYLPPGAGPHPALVICHGLPGNEKNLDIAQAVRRAGWVAVTFNYRGSWGSGGKFTFSGNPEDASAVLAYLREPKTAASLRLDPSRIAIAGHSMGGWVAARTAARDPALLGAILISAWDPSRPLAHDERVRFMAGDMESLMGVTADSMAAEVESHLQEFALINSTRGLAGTPLLVLTSDDGLAPAAEALAKAVKSAGGQRVSAVHVATDHAWSDRRIELESQIVRWLGALPNVH